jgi:hypothetical protein
VVDRLQPPLYAVLAAEALTGEAVPAGGLYVGILAGRRDGVVRDDVGHSDRPPKGHEVPARRWQALVDDAVEAARRAARDLRAGRFEPMPVGLCTHWCRCGDLWR